PPRKADDASCLPPPVWAEVTLPEGASEAQRLIVELRLSMVIFSVGRSVAALRRDEEPSESWNCRCLRVFRGGTGAFAPAASSCGVDHGHLAAKRRTECRSSFPPFCWPSPSQSAALFGTQVGIAG